MPVCVDEVTDIARFDNITNVDPANLLNAADNVAVSYLIFSCSL